MSICWKLSFPCKSYELEEYFLIRTSGCAVWLKEPASWPKPCWVAGLWLRDATANPSKIIQNYEDLKDASVNICLLLNISHRGITTSDDKFLAKMINLSDLGWHLQWVELTLKMPWRIHCHCIVGWTDKLCLAFPLKTWLGNLKRLWGTGSYP